MAYSTTNPPMIIAAPLSGGPRMWTYTSADDDATVNGADYFTNGYDLGMEVGDFVFVFDTATPKGSVHSVQTVASEVVTLGFCAVS